MTGRATALWQVDRSRRSSSRLAGGQVVEDDRGPSTPARSRIRSPCISMIDNYDSFTYNLWHFLGELGGRSRCNRNDAIGGGRRAWRADPTASSSRRARATPTRPASASTWSRGSRAKSAGARRLPGPSVSIGQAFGGDHRARAGAHARQAERHHAYDGDGVFAGLPGPFEATRYHSLVVERDSVPDCLDITAETDDGIVMGLQHASCRSTACSSIRRASPRSTATRC